MGGAAGGSSGSKWYADWTSGDDTCKNDGKAPEYMTAAAVNWLYDDQEDCCEYNLMIFLRHLNTFHV